MLHDLLFRLQTLFRRHAAERELDDELRFHLERQISKYLKSGMSEKEATRPPGWNSAVSIRSRRSAETREALVLSRRLCRTCATPLEPCFVRPRSPFVPC